MNPTYDVVVIGAGSVGIPIAFSLAEKGMKVCVLERHRGFSQGQNKAAIGGIRATHSDASKVWLCLESLDVFRNWKDRQGDDIAWHSGGYCFPSYTEKSESYFKKLLEAQQNFGLNIKWVSPDEIDELVPGINRDGLRGGTISPEDGSASPLLASMAFYRYARSLGVDFHFDEPVTEFVRGTERVEAVKTAQRSVSAAHFILACGAEAREMGAMLDLDIPVFPDCHEAGITEPVERFFEPMVVDIRGERDSKNYYFYQNEEGQVIFCITPEPAIVGRNRNSTSAFLPMMSRRMLELYPRLANLKVRRTWRGLYPMTPDGSPIVGEVRDFKNLRLAVGMCGQGYMLGPGIGRLFGRWYGDSLTDKDRQILQKLTLYGDFSKSVEELK